MFVGTTKSVYRCLLIRWFSVRAQVPMQINLELRLSSGTMLSGVASRAHSASAARSTFVALSAFVSGRKISPMESMGGTQNTDGNKIKAICVSGTKRLEPETVRSYVKLRLGQAYNSDALDMAILDIFATELFADAQIRDDDGVLTISVRENPVINRIVFEGNKSIKQDKLFRELKLVPRQLLTRSKVRANAVRIMELYHRQGHLAATVEPMMFTLDHDRVDVIFEISEGPKSNASQKKIVRNKVFERDKVAAKKASDSRSRGVVKSLGFFQENLEIIQRPGSDPSRIVLEANVEGSSDSELEFSKGSLSLERFILNASIKYREKGQELRALIDVSDQESIADSASVSDEIDKNLNASDICIPMSPSPAPDSSIIATKVGIDTFLDRKLVELQATTVKPENSNFRGLRSVNIYNNIAELINIDYPLSFEKQLLFLIYNRGVYSELQNIIAAERCLKFEDDSTRRNVLARSLEVPLESVFDEAGYPEALRPIFIGRIVDEILSYGVAGREPWAARVIKDVSTKSLSTGSHPPLPETPPALWKIDKQPGDAPPDFIKRHYGPWLRSDAMGLTRPDIKRLDASLYMALANWLRKNELPSDCPIPDRTARLDAELTRFLERGIGAIVTGPSDPEHVLREARRMASATQRRR
jgi:hypothetical protein